MSLSIPRMALVVLIFPWLGALLGTAAPAGAGAAGEMDGRVDVLPSARPRVALVLSGGGARGFAHIGILRAFEEAGVPFDLITGTSMGAIVGSLFACGYSPEEIEQLIRSIDWVRLLKPESGRSPLVSARYGEARGVLTLRFRRLEPKTAPGLLPAQRVYELLLRLTGEADATFGGQFDSLMVPIRIVTADLKRGQLVTFARGHLAKCILASMAIPFFFPPVAWGDWLLVDGGLLDNTPVDVARQWGADLVIAVDVSSIGEREVRFDDMIDVFRRTMDIWMTRTNRLYSEKPDLLLRPYLEQRSPLDYPAADTLIALGYRYGRAVLDSVKRLVPWRRDWGALRERFRRRLVRARPGWFCEPALAGLKRTHPSVLWPEISVRENAPFRVSTVLRDVRTLYKTGLFDQVLADLQRRDERVCVTYEFREREPFDLSLGGSYVNDEGEGGFLQFRHMNVFGYGGRGLLSWRFGPQRRFLAAELEAPRVLGVPLSAHATVFWERNRPWWYAGGEPVARRQFELAGVQVSSGVALSEATMLSLVVSAVNGLRFGHRALGLRREGWRERSIELALVTDGLDDPFVPTKGLFQKLVVRRGLKRLGGTLSGSTVEGDARWYVPWRDVVWGFLLRFGFVPNRYPEELWYRLGGPAGFQGLRRGELWRPCFAAATLETQYRYSSVLRLTAALGVGWASSRFGALFSAQPFVGSRAGVRLVTPIGPVSLDVAYGEGGRWTYYLSVGYVF